MNNIEKPETVEQDRWIPASTPNRASIAPEIAIARVIAVDRPQQLFDAILGLRSVQLRSANTYRSYCADWAIFVECCQLHHCPALPASAAALQTFIEWRSPEQSELVNKGMYRYVLAGAPRRPAAAATLRRALIAIGSIHEWLEFPDPTEHQAVRDTLTINIKGRRIQSQKDPLRWADLERACGLMGDTPWAIRDRALAAVAYSTMFDRTELVELRRQDYDREPHQDVGRMLVRKTETREPMQREYQPVIPEAVYFLEAWLRASNITDGPLFRGIMPDGRVRKTALSAGQVAHAFKGIARTAGIADISRISGHSMRIGALHDLKHFGGNLLDIMQAGRWKSPVMPGRYLDRLDSESEEDPMLRMARAR